MDSGRNILGEDAPQQENIWTLMEDGEAKAALEALLFALGESASLAQLSQVLQKSQEEVRALAEKLEEEYAASGRGLEILWLGDRLQLAAKRRFYPLLQSLVSQPPKAKLTDSLLETLSVVAYKQPVTKMDVERARGVNSDHGINKLLEYGLIQELGRLDAPGRPLLFGTTEEFLRSFGVRDLAALPPLDPGQVEAWKAEAEREAQGVEV